MENLSGLYCNVYRASEFPDCTNNGITSRTSRIILIDETQSGPFVPDKDEIYLLLVQNDSKSKGYIYAEPRMNGEKINDLDYGMFGGNFVYSSDSRFPSDYPIPVHDRFESQATYDALSR